MTLPPYANGMMRAALGTLALVLIPLIAMQFTSEVLWTLSDFVIMGTILFITGNLLDLAVRKTGKHRLAMIVLILFLFLWLWAELAVGAFTNWGN